MKILLIFASTISLLSVLTISGCGQSGPLYMPRPQTKNPTTPAKKIQPPSHETTS